MKVCVNGCEIRTGPSPRRPCPQLPSGDVFAQPGEAGTQWLRGTPSPRWLLPTPFLQEALRPLGKECFSYSTLLKPTPHVQRRGPCYFSLVLEFASVLMVRCPWIQATTKLLNLPTRGGLGPGLGGRARQMAVGVGGEMNIEKWVVGPLLSLMWWEGSPPRLCPGSPTPDIVSLGPQLLTGPVHSPGCFPMSSGTRSVSFPGETLTLPGPFPQTAPWGGSPWGPPAQPILSVTSLSVLPSRAPPHPHPP